MHLIDVRASDRRVAELRAPDFAALTPRAISEQTDERARATAWTIAVHDEITRLLTALDHGGRFAEELWTREGGGGGVSRLLTDGTTFEKAGANRSAVFGPLPNEVRRALGGRAAAADVGPLDFFATGVSVVVHPRSPLVPTVHLNVRYFELTDASGARVDAWFGGGTDLTPTHPQPEDARHFHRALAAAVAPFGPAVYARGKAWCDEYFSNAHRGGERRGVGGIFYDHVRPGEGVAEQLNAAALHGLSAAVGTVLTAGYAPIVDRHRDEPYGEAERALQLERRARYAEFNLLHDRGTLFGLRTHARIDSVLMSLPPMAAWASSGAHAPGSTGARLTQMLAVRDWLAAGAGDEVLA